MRLIDADKLKQHYAWWGDGGEKYKERKEIFDTIIDLQPTIESCDDVTCKTCVYNTANMERDPLDIEDYTDIVCSYWMSDGLDETKDFCSQYKKAEAETLPPKE